MDPVLLVAAGAAVALGYGVINYNRLVALDERCNLAFADIDVHLKRRHDLIPNLVETVRGFAGHEKTILVELARCRAEALQAVGPEMKLKAETQVGQSINSILAMSENYPELQASGHFRELRNELLDAENRITASRRFYNLAVDELNSTLRQFPGSLVGSLGRVARRRPFDLGIERVALADPIAIRF